jgi:hypothetical protein
MEAPPRCAFLVARLTSRWSNISAKSCHFQLDLENVSGAP